VFRVRFLGSMELIVVDLDIVVRIAMPFVAFSIERA
jgi:hypothetical protein